MVPTVRLELTQLSPLPPQDSVSTNFTMSALFLFNPGSDRICSDHSAAVRQERPEQLIQPARTSPREKTRCAVLRETPEPDKLRKKIAAHTAVVRLRKLAEPDAPNRLPDEPPPKGSPHIRALAMLHQYQHDHCQRGSHIQNPDQRFKNFHILSIWQRRSKRF